MVIARLPIAGMSCHHCVQALTQALQRLPGVHRAEVTLERHQALIEYDPDRTTLEAMTEAVRGAGYEVPGGVQAAQVIV